MGICRHISWPLWHAGAAAAHSTCESVLNPPKKHWGFNGRRRRNMKNMERCQSRVWKLLCNVCLIVRNGKSAWRKGRPVIMTSHHSQTSLAPATWPGSITRFIWPSLHSSCLAVLKEDPLIEETYKINQMSVYLFTVVDLNVVHGFFCLQRVCRTGPCLRGRLSEKGKQLNGQNVFPIGHYCPLLAEEPLL